MPSTQTPAPLQCGALGGLTACDASNGDFTVPGEQGGKQRMLRWGAACRCDPQYCMASAVLSSPDARPLPRLTSPPCPLCCPLPSPLPAGKLTITDGTRNIVIDPTTLTITTSAQRLNIGAVGNPHTLTVSGPAPCPSRAIGCRLCRQRVAQNQPPYARLACLASPCNGRLTCP